MSQGYGVSTMWSDSEGMLVTLHEERLGSLEPDDQEFVEELWERMRDGGFECSTVEYMRLRVIWEQSL